MDSKTINYRDALLDALLNRELVRSYDKLTQSNLGSCIREMSRQSINHQIDVATGHLQDQLHKFNLFFMDVIWSRLPPEAFTSAEHE